MKTGNPSPVFKERRNREKKVNNNNICPVCNKYLFQYDLEECPICGWVNDDYQEDFPELKGANSYSLNQAKQAYAAGKKTE